jgi:hypothetical protein
MARAARARECGARAHVRNVPSSVLPNSTVRNLESPNTRTLYFFAHLSVRLIN